MPRAGVRRPGRAGWIAVAALLVVAAAAGAFLLLSGADDENSATAYKQKVAAAFGPVLGANRQVSDQLARLRGTQRGARAGDARVAVRRAQQAVTLATGAVGALNAPSSSEQLARDARQALDRESAYYGEVARVLARPASTSTANLSDLASNLTSALSVAGPTVAGAEPTVSGTDRLATWARTIRVRAQRSAADRRDRNDNRRTPVPNNGGGGSSAPASRTTDCGGGVIAGPNTSCSFAQNVRDAWLDAPGTTNTVRVFSPVTNETYTMSCSPSGRGVSCSGANDASVTFGG
jgi:hypothetical protein